MPKPTGIADAKLQNIVDALFRERPAGGAQIGDGSAMAALNHELTNPGARVGGRSHATKIAETIGALEKLKSKHDSPRSPYRLEQADLNIVVDLLAACRKAQRGEYTG
jgi:hypothetical protein